MTSERLRRVAEACGVTTSYRDWRGRRVEVSEETIMAILDAFGEDPGAGTAPRSAWHRPAPPAPRRCWGFAVQLYSVRSRQSWGHGDLRDLADLAVWSARELAAGFVLINPLHAAEPAPPVSPSPYLPMSRRFLSPLYLRVEDIPEYQTLGPRRAAASGATGRAAAGPQPHRGSHRP